MDWFQEKLLRVQREHREKLFTAARKEIEDRKLGGPTPDCLTYAALQRICEGRLSDEDSFHLEQCPSCRRFAHACAEGFYSPRRRWKRFRARMGGYWFLSLYRVRWWG